MTSAVDPTTPLYLGLMSGTSADGIDAALVQFPAEGGCRFVDGLTHVWDPAIRAELIALGEGGTITSLDALGRLDAEVGITFAAAANRLLDSARIDRTQVQAIGSHGQTVRHRPLADPAFTMQIGDANRIAELTGITTVADFRRRDVAAGGHGAPLMPAFHLAMLGDSDEDRAVLNLGGIGNLTLIPRQGTPRGFDTGPANVFLDAWCQRHLGQPYDADGRWAATGQVVAPLLEQLIASEPWFALPPPKSTGRDRFNLQWLDDRLAAFDGPKPAPQDVQATLQRLTARTVANAIDAAAAGTQEVFVCGGGAYNAGLMRELAYCLQRPVQATDVLGVPAQQVEALAFAWLAQAFVERRPAGLPAVTGARGARILGALYPA